MVASRRKKNWPHCARSLPTSSRYGERRLSIRRNVCGGQYNRFYEEISKRILWIVEGGRCSAPCRCQTEQFLATGRFREKKGSSLFLMEICRIEYIHELLLAPAREMLDRYRKRKGSWENYEREFLALLSERRVEEPIQPDM